MVRRFSRRAILARALLMMLAAACGVACAGGQSAGVVATSVPLLLPTGVAYDGAGNLYIAEAGMHRVRRVDTQGMITTVAGDGSQGYSGDGAAATAAQMDTPTCVAVDAVGDLYVCDSHNHRIRRVDGVTGVMTTEVGTGAAGFAGDGGLARAAVLDLPVAVAVNAAGNLWVADARSHRVRKVDAGTGVIRTVAGTGVQGFAGDGGLAVAAALDAPSSLAVDAAGNVYVADAHNRRVRRVDAGTGVISTVAGGAGELRLPRGVTVDASGALYISDASAFRVRRVDAGVGTVVVGSGMEGFSGDLGAPTVATMGRPAGVAISPSGLVTVAEAGDGRVRQVTAAPVIETVAGLGSGVVVPKLSAVTLVVTGAGTTAYGSGAVGVQVGTSGAATGRLTLLDGGVGVGTAAVVGNAGVFSVASMGAGVHALSVSYSGDAAHAAAVSAGIGLTVTPAPVTVVVNGTTAAFGAAVPGFSGMVSGLLAQDAGKVGVVYGTVAGVGSAVGTYPIRASLSGAAAADYALSAVTPGVLTVVQAGTATAIGSAVVQSGDGSVLATVAVRSATTGVPTGSVTLLDGGTPVAAGPVGGTGSVVLGSGSLASGAHSFTAFYAGDGDFVASTSVAFPVTVGGAGSGAGGGSGAGPSADFALSMTGASTQTVSGGSSVDFAMWAKWTGATMSSPVTLAVSGLPAFATASFNPGYLPPGGAVSAFTMTVAMPATVAGVGVGGRVVMAMCLGLPVLLAGGRRRRFGRVVWVVLVGVGLMGVTGCGDRVTGTTDGAGVTKVSYPLVVTGTGSDGNGGTLQRTVQVVLVVESGG